MLQTHMIVKVFQNLDYFHFSDIPHLLFLFKKVKIFVSSYKNLQLLVLCSCHEYKISHAVLPDILGVIVSQVVQVVWITY